MITRRRNSPGIEINEITRSQQTVKVDYSLPKAPVCFMCGFTDSGENYTTKWINTEETLIGEYGPPKTEFEKYFYNGAMEILKKGGLLLTSKLPYDNEAKDQYTYTTYQIESKNGVKIQEAISSTIYNTIYQNVTDIQDTCLSVITHKDLNPTDYVLYTIDGLDNTITDFANIFTVQGLDIPTDITELSANLVHVINQISGDGRFFDIAFNDSYIKKYINIIEDSSGKIPLDKLDQYTIRNLTTLTDKITIVDLTAGRYARAASSNSFIRGAADQLSTFTNDCLGILPVIVSPANALYFQNLLHNVASGSIYNVISGIGSVTNPKIIQDFSKFADNSFIPLSSNTLNDMSVSRLAVNQFPTISYRNDEHFDPTFLKQIGVVVFKMYKDIANGELINYELVESFVGALDKTARNQITGASIFIDTIVNTRSKYINVFSNVNPVLLNNCDIITCQNQKVTSLGFYELECKKNISYTTSIMEPLDMILGSMTDPNSYVLDVIVDAGISTIAQFQRYVNFNNDKDFGSWVINLNNKTVGSVNAIRDQFKYWQSILDKFDNFAKYARKDCIFIADGLRPVCLEGNEKIVRRTKPTNTVSKDIIPKIKYMCELNSSYSAGYLDWFQTTDAFSGDMIWLPPSIKAAGVFCYVDTYCHTWDAPAGLARGGISDVYDIAFNPSEDEAGQIYTKQWNYAKSYPLGGIVLEGQKTFQQNNTSMDRISTRRLLLYLENQVKKVAQFYAYKENTAFVRQMFVDAITPLFQDAVRGGGLDTFYIKCDDQNNTEQTKNNREFICSIAVKTTTSIEFIILNFLASSQSTMINEETLNNI